MFKRILQIGIILVGSVSMQAWAISLTDGTEVGSIDTFLASDVMQGNSNPTTEETWVNDTLDALGLMPTDYTVRIDGDPALLATATADVYAVDLSPNTPDYFLVKNATYIALYSNSADLMWGVFDASLLPDGMNIGDTTVSHVTLFGDGGNVPEPGILGLLGIGLLGMFLGRRRKAV